MKGNRVSFKGILGGLGIYIEPGLDIDILKDEIKKKLDSGKGFYRDTEVNLAFSGREFSGNEKRDLLNYIAEHIRLGKVEFTEQSIKEEAQIKNIASYGTEEGMARFFRGTLRNGQRVDYKGNIIVMGDVNPGAEVVAGGNIIVLGNLRGMAHAGAAGDMDAVVIALFLQPTQLRIGSIITRSPEDETERPQYPEIAYIKDGGMLIEPYTPGKIKY
ncbi:MAG: septum site-determining protein MinC [Clostridiales bacterium]|nr:septum site-determining protein MinC [Clostridiales bacterium]